MGIHVPKKNNNTRKQQNSNVTCLVIRWKIITLFFTIDVMDHNKGLTHAPPSYLSGISMGYVINYIMSIIPIVCSELYDAVATCCGVCGAGCRLRARLSGVTSLAHARLYLCAGRSARSFDCQRARRAPRVTWTTSSVSNAKLFNIIFIFCVIDCSVTKCRRIF